MVLLQTTVHAKVHGWLSARALNTGVSVASLVRSVIMERWSVAPEEPGQRALVVKPVRPRQRNKAKKVKPKSTRQLALPGTAGKAKRERRPRRTKAQRRGLNHIEPEAAQ